MINETLWPYESRCSVNSCGLTLFIIYINDFPDNFEIILHEKVDTTLYNISQRFLTNK